MEMDAFVAGGSDLELFKRHTWILKTFRLRGIVLEVDASHLQRFMLFFIDYLRSFAVLLVFELVGSSVC